MWYIIYNNHVSTSVLPHLMVELQHSSLLLMSFESFSKNEKFLIQHALSQSSRPYISVSFGVSKGTAKQKKKFNSP